MLNSDNTLLEISKPFREKLLNEGFVTCRITVQPELTFCATRFVAIGKVPLNYTIEKMQEEYDTSNKCIQQFIVRDLKFLNRIQTNTIDSGDYCEIGYDLLYPKKRGKYYVFVLKNDDGEIIETLSKKNTINLILENVKNLAKDINVSFKDFDPTSYKVLKEGNLIIRFEKVISSFIITKEVSLGEDVDELNKILCAQIERSFDVIEKLGLSIMEGLSPEVRQIIKEIYEKSHSHSIIFPKML